MENYENTTVGDLLGMDTEELLQAIGKGSSPLFDFLMQLLRKRKIARMAKVRDYQEIDYRGKKLEENLLLDGTQRWNTSIIWSRQKSTTTILLQKLTRTTSTLPAQTASILKMAAFQVTRTLFFSNG